MLAATISRGAHVLTFTIIETIITAPVKDASAAVMATTFRRMITDLSTLTVIRS